MTNDTHPATKADIQMLMETIGNLYDANAKWKDEILAAQQRWKDELAGHFDLVFENFSRDLSGAYGDRYEGLRQVQREHGRRLNRLEARVGMSD